MATITKRDLIDRIVAETDEKRTAVKRTVQCFLDNIIDELRRGNRLEFRDFGVFEIRTRAPRGLRTPPGNPTVARYPRPLLRSRALLGQATRPEHAEG